MTYFNDMWQLFSWVMSQVPAWCKSPDVPRVLMEQKRAITRGNKLDYFILSGLFFSPQFITTDDMPENADIDLYIQDQVMLSELWGLGWKDSEINSA